MPEYRAYIVGHDGHFQSAAPLICPNDEAAKIEALKLVDGHNVELWDGVRKVAVFKHKRLNAGTE